MSVTGLSADKCAQRNRLAALRDGVNSASVRLLRQMPGTDKPDGLLYAHGTLPTDEADALDRINSMCPDDGTEPLTADDVYILYLEAANTNFIPDRYMFLDEKTLRNVAREAQDGFAFMNSHRTGSMSHPSELPFGKTFAGRFEQYKAVGDAPAFSRALLGVYMVRGVYPNGANGPSTDALYQGVQAGTIFDVSVGLYGGTPVCDICGNDVNDEDECSHIPGTTLGLSQEQIAAQKARGVKNGAASYTYTNAHCTEVSAVYDGAVPGAGFSKARHAVKEHRLSGVALSQARGAYAQLFSKGDFSMYEPEEMIEQASDSIVEKLFRRLTGHNNNNLQQTQAATPPVLAPELVVTETLTVAADPEPTQLQPIVQREDLERQLAESRAQLARVNAERRLERATATVDGLITAGKMYPSERAAALALFSRAMEDDDTNPQLATFAASDGTQVEATRTQLLEAQYAARPAHNLTTEKIAAFAAGTYNDPPSTEKPKSPLYEREAQKMKEQAATVRSNN